MTNFPNFRTVSKFLMPYWLSSGDGELVNYSLDLMRDAFIERCRLGLLARFPQNGPNGELAPDDALVQMGNDRRVVRGINETSASYALRLIQWLDDRITQGSPFTLMKKLAEYTGGGALTGVCSFRTVDARGNWYSRDVNGNNTVLLNQQNWDWDGTPAITNRWSRFWVIIYPPSSLWTTNPDWDDVTGPSWTDPIDTWGSTATDDEVSTIQSLVSEWKPAGTRCVNIIIAFDPASFVPTAARESTGLPDGYWDHWSRRVGGVRVPARLSTARYWDGV